MKYHFISLLFLLLIMTSCNDTEEVILYESTGQLIGLDMAMSPCSGGIIVVLNDDATSYRIEEFPSDFEMDVQTATFPLDVQLNWTLNRECAWNVFIDVDDIAYLE
ncbi:MAG: hypothetical protein ACI94Y_003522 [Maribacter sp.]|jgi:hypothetical protein